MVLLPAASSGHMSNRHLYRPLRSLGPGCQVVNRVENVCAIIAVPASIADPNRDIFQYNETALVLECLSFDPLGPNRSITVFA
jgi:hypothetical protein